MSDRAEPLPPAFYAASTTRRRAITDWWLLLHPPYTLWHLSYVAIGAAIAPRFDGGRLAATLVAFLFAVGIGAHALDELHGRPLRTKIPGWLLVTAAAASLSIAVALGVIGVARVGASQIVFIVAGVILNCCYNLELFGGRLHTDTVFAAAWGAFPVLTGYYAQHERLDIAAVAAGVLCFLLSRAQRELSTPARALRRKTSEVTGTIVHADGSIDEIDQAALLAPLEGALRALSWAAVSLAVTLALARLGPWP